MDSLTDVKHSQASTSQFVQLARHGANMSIDVAAAHS